MTDSIPQLAALSCDFSHLLWLSLPTAGVCSIGPLPLVAQSLGSWRDVLAIPGTGLLIDLAKSI